MTVENEAARRRKLAAVWAGEGFREAAVLIMVFVPLDWILGRHENRLAVSLISFAVAAAVFGIGVRFGFLGEPPAEEERRE